MTQHHHAIETLFAGEVTEADLRQLAELHCAAFPKPGRHPEGVMDRWRTPWVSCDQPESFRPRMFIVRESAGEQEADASREAGVGRRERQSAMPRKHSGTGAPSRTTDATRVVAMAAVTARRIELLDHEAAQRDRWWSVMALAHVASSPDRRGTGLGEAVVRAAFEVVDRDELPTSLFQTRYHVQPFYEKFGACLVEHNTFVNSRADDPTASPWWNDVVMRYPANAPWPTGRIDLHGPAW